MRSVLFAMMLSCVALPAAAQDGDVAAQIVATIAEAEQLLAAEDVEGALALIFRANDLGFHQDAMDPVVRFLPNLAAARAYRLRHDWPEVERYAAAALRALDGRAHALHPVRLEAAGRLGQALLRQGRASEAAAILRPVLEEVDAAGGVTTPEAALVEFWLAATVARLRGPEWGSLGRRVMTGVLHKERVALPEFAAFVYDFATLRQAVGGSDASLLEITGLLAMLAGHPEVMDLDRAAYLELHAQVLDDLGRDAEAAALMEAELEALAERRRGTQRYLAVGLRLALLWLFDLDRAPDAVALLERLLEEAEPGANPSATGFLMTVRGFGLDHLGRNGEAQAAYRAGYALLRQVLPAHAPQALETASLIRRDDPGFAEFAFAAELTDPSVIAADGPAEAVMERFLSGLYAQNELVLMGRDGLPEGGNLADWLRNRVLHLALSGRGSRMAEELSELRAAGLAQEPDRLQLFEAVGGFWLNGRRPQDAPELFAALDGLEMRMPPDQASLVRALRLAALNFDGRSAETIAGLRDWVDARDMARQPRTVWDIAAAMIATELGWLYLPRDLASQVMADSLAEVAAMPGAVLARDYLHLVRLLNAASDMETDRGLVELAALVQRVSAQVPEGHILRATTRFGLSNALAARDRLEEAQAMLAEAAEAYRENPGHRADVLAFMQAMQAQALSRTGRSDLALNLARAAYAGLKDGARADYRMTVVIVLAWELLTQGRAEEAVALAERELTDPALLEPLVPFFRLDALRNRAGIYRAAGDLARSEALLAEAAAMVAAEPDMPLGGKVALLWDQGLTHYHARRYPEAFAAFVASNDGYEESRRAVAQLSASGRAALRAEDAMRARAEAQVGWDLVQALRREAAALVTARQVSAPKGR